MKQVLSTFLVASLSFAAAQADSGELSQAAQNSIKQCLVETVLADKKVTSKTHSLLTALSARKVGVLSTKNVDQIASVTNSCDDLNTQIIALMGDPKFKQDLISKSVQADRTIKGYVQMNPNRGNCENTEIIGTSMSLVEGLKEVNFTSKGIVLSGGGHGMAGMFDAIIVNLSMIRLEMANNKKVASMVNSFSSLDCRGLEKEIFNNLDLFKANGPFLELVSSDPQRNILEAVAEVLVK